MNAQLNTAALAETARAAYDKFKKSSYWYGITKTNAYRPGQIAQARESMEKAEAAMRAARADLKAARVAIRNARH